MIAVAEIFLGNLKFHHLIRGRHRPEERTERFAGLEIYRAVLDLHDYVGVKLPVERLKLQVGLLRTVGIPGE